MDFIKKIKEMMDENKKGNGAQGGFPQQPHGAAPGNRGASDSFYGQPAAPPQAQAYPPQPQAYPPHPQGYAAPSPGYPQQQPYGQAPPPAVSPPAPYGAPPQLPPGWTQQWDQNSQRWFYIEQATGRTQWEAPAMAPPAPYAPPAGGAPPYAPPAGSAPPYMAPVAQNERALGNAQPTAYVVAEPEKKKKGPSGAAIAAVGVGGLAAGALIASALSDDHELEYRREAMAQEDGWDSD